MNKNIVFIVITILFSIILFNTTNAQAPIKIGEVGVSGPTITYDYNDLVTAFVESWDDSVMVEEVLIELMNGTYYLIAFGMLDSNSRSQTIPLIEIENGGVIELELTIAATCWKCIGTDGCTKCYYDSVTCICMSGKSGSSCRLGKAEVNRVYSYL